MSMTTRTLAFAALATLVAAPALAKQDKEVIQRAIRDHLHEVKYCYERALVTNKSLEGKLVLHLEVAATGQVTKASIAEGTTLADKGMQDCVVDLANKWKLPVDEKTVINYPFDLRNEAPNK